MSSHNPDRESRDNTSEARPHNPPTGNGQPDSLADSTAPGPSPPTGEESWDLDSLRFSQDFAAEVGVRKVLTKVPVRKPDDTWWVRTHVDPSYRLEAGLLVLKDDREVYLVNPGLCPELRGKGLAFSVQLLIASVNRQGTLFLWPISLPGKDGKWNSWHQSQMEAADQARTHWTKMFFVDLTLQAYAHEVSESIRDEPKWPDLSMPEILKVAFKNNRISTWDDPVLQHLRGEV
jgi:hypothetical protein